MCYARNMWIKSIQSLAYLYRSRHNTPRSPHYTTHPCTSQLSTFGTPLSMVGNFPFLVSQYTSLYIPSRLSFDKRHDIGTHRHASRLCRLANPLITFSESLKPWSTASLMPIHPQSYNKIKSTPSSYLEAWGFPSITQFLGLRKQQLAHTSSTVFIACFLLCRAPNAWQLLDRCFAGLPLIQKLEHWPFH